VLFLTIFLTISPTKPTVCAGPGGLGNIINFHDPREYKMANAYMLAWDFGHTRIMSSYWWDQQIDDGIDINDWWGPPSDDQVCTEGQGNGAWVNR
jgi:alpha-amylase